MRISYLLLLTVGISGCSLFYSNSYFTEDFTIYSNREQELVDRTGRDTERLFEIYNILLDTCLKGDHLTIVLSGSGTETKPDSGNGSLMGYFIPYWDYISIDTSHGALFKDGKVDYDSMRIVLIHEVAHYFLLTKWPSLEYKPWLNEGLASVFETLLFDNEVAELPYFNPPLFYNTYSAIRKGKAETLVELTSMTWRDFHSNEKSRRYSLAWSLCMYLLTVELSGDLALDQKIDLMSKMEPEDFVEIQDRWSAYFLFFDAEAILEAFVEHPTLTLTPIWAQEELDHLRAKEKE